MSFTPNIPRSNQTLGNSRLQILNNFAALRETISEGSGDPVLGQPNHIDVNNGSGQGAGKHIFVQMPVQVASARNLPALNEGGLITQLSGGSSELYYARDAVNTRYQMTGPLFTGQSALAQGGTTMLFGGIILKWGRISVTGVIVFATQCGSAFPNNCFSITASRSVTNSFTITAISNTQFTFSGGGGGTTDFIAIGN